MGLTPRQFITIEHLANRGIISPQEIINYCKSKLLLPAYNPNQKGRPHRRHGKKYFEEIIAYYQEMTK